MNSTRLPSAASVDMISWWPCQMKSQSMDEMQTTSVPRLMRSPRLLPGHHVGGQGARDGLRELLVARSPAEMDIVGKNRRRHVVVDPARVEKADLVRPREIRERFRRPIVERAHDLFAVCIRR